MIDFEKPFICNRDFLKANYRENCGYDFSKISEEFQYVLRHTPVQKHLPKTQYGPKELNFSECKNLLDELYRLEGKILYSENEDDEQAFEDYVFPYAAMFLTTKEYNDDLLCYLYVVGAEYCNPWSLCDDTCDEQKYLDDYYANKLTRQRVIEIIARCLVLDFMCDGDVSYCNCEFSLEDYEEQMAEREIKENKK